MIESKQVTSTQTRRAAVFGAAVCAVLAVVPKAMAAERTHDGFYLQIDAGLGYYKTSVDVPRADASYSGITAASGLLIGGSLIPGLVLGGGILTDYAPSPKYKANGRESPSGNFSQYVLGIGPFVDVYPDPHKGLHFQGMIGFGGLETSANGNAGGSDPTGVLVSIGGGYEWWVAREWSIGAMGRLIYAPLKLNGVSYTTIAPALLATFTYH